MLDDAHSMIHLFHEFSEVTTRPNSYMYFFIIKRYHISNYRTCFPSVCMLICIHC